MIGGLSVPEKFKLVREKQEEFSKLHKKLYLPKFSSLWGKLPTPESLEVEDIVYLPDKSKKHYPTLGRVTKVEGSVATITYMTAKCQKRAQTCIL